MARYRKLPVEVEAVLWEGSWNTLDFPDWLIEAKAHKEVRTSTLGASCPYLMIDTKEGTMTAGPGDWIICRVKGELYPCKPDIFELTYEYVEITE